MSTTIAYSHKGGYWKTKYSFFACFMRSVGRKFFSSPSIGATEGTGSVLDSLGGGTAGEGLSISLQSLIWKHNSVDDDKRTNFYGVPGGSGISVAFNDRVSSNKIYKSISLEGSNNIANNALNTFVVNSDNNPNKQFSIGPVKDKGGMLYGHIGLSGSVADGSNIRVLGSLKIVLGIGTTTGFYPFGPPEAFPEGFEGADNTIPGYDRGMAITVNPDTNIPITKSSVTGNSKYFFVVEDGSAYSIDGNEINLSNISSASYSDPQFGLPYDLDFLTVDPASFIIFENSEFSATDSFTEFPEEIKNKTVTLCEITPQNINGAPPRGQYAQAEILFGTEPYELFALNVNYETTDLDHSK